MKEEIASSLFTIGDSTPIQKITTVSGGDINQAYYVETNDHIYFVKTNSNVPKDFFKVEAHGLSLIAATNTVRVPQVYYWSANTDNVLLILEWIEGESTPYTAALLGRDLANLHLHTNNQYGFAHSTFIGTIPQQNGLFDDWVSYYSNQRLFSQLILAEQIGRLPDQRRKRLDYVIEHLDKWIDPYPNASLLHGDLWSGNWIVGQEGYPYLIDPSVVYGDRAFEIAFTELFGGFSNEFYEAYESVNPLPLNYNDTKPLYQLFYLLVHLNLFGEGYGRSVDRILTRFSPF